MPESSSKQTARNDSGEIATSTLAEIYAQQGLLGRALSIYRRMLARAPEDAGIADRIRSLEVRMAEAGPEPQPEPAAVPPAGRERLPWDPPEIEAPALAAPVPEAPAAEAPKPETPTLEAPTPQVRAPEAPLPQAHAESAEPAAPRADPSRRPDRMDAEAFRAWLDRH